MAPNSNHVAVSSLVLQVAFFARGHTSAYIGTGPLARIGPHRPSTTWRCRPNKLAVAASASKGSPGESSPAAGVAADKIASAAAAIEADERKTARWGVSPAPSQKGSNNPLKVVASSIGAVGDGARAAKDALYEVADAAGSLVEFTKQISAEGNTTGTLPSPLSFQGTIRDGSKQGTSPSTARSGRAGASSGLGGALQAIGTGAVLAKDAFWGSIELLGAASDAVRNAPETAKTAAESGKATLEAAKSSAQAIVSAPGKAVEVVSDAAESVSRAAGAVKDVAYGTADAIAKVANAPGEISKRRQREQEELYERRLEDAEARREASRKLDGAVTGARDVIWGTVDGVGNLVDTVVSTPAALENGFTQAQETTESLVKTTSDLAKTTGDFVQSIPRTVQDIPVQAQRKVDGVRTSVGSARDNVVGFVSGVKDGVEGAASFAQRISNEATGEAKRKREEARREAERREKEEARRKKERDAVLTFRGEPYTAGDLVQVGIKAGGQAARGAVEVGKGAVWVAGKAWTVPGKVTRTVLGPVYNYRQSQQRVQEALREQRTAMREPAPVPPPARETPRGLQGSPTEAAPQQPRLTEEAPAVKNSAEGKPVPSAAATPSAAGSPGVSTPPIMADPPVPSPQEGAVDTVDAAGSVVADEGASVDKATRRDYRPSWEKSKADRS